MKDQPLTELQSFFLSSRPTMEELKQIRVLFFEKFDSSKNALEARLVELEKHFGSEEKTLEKRKKELEAKVSNFKSEMESITKELHKVESLIEEKGKEVGVKEKRLVEVEKLVDQKERDCELMQRCIELKMRQLNQIRGFIEEGNREFDLKQEQVEALRKSIEECDQEMKSKSHKLEAMEKKVTRLQDVLNKFCDDIDVKRRQLNGICEDIEVKQRHLDGISQDIDEKRSQVSSNRGSIEEGKNVTDGQIIAARKSLDECNEEKIIREMEAKVKDFGLLKKSMEEWSCKVGEKERELEGWVEKLEFREKQVESMLEELSVIDKRASECLNELQSKEHHFDSLDKLIQERKSHLDSQERSFQERSHGLTMRENKLEEQARELLLKQKKTASTVNAMEEPIKNLKSEGKTLVRSPCLQLNATTDIGNLLSPPNEILSENYSVQTKMCVDLQKSADPERPVLELMQTSFATLQSLKAKVGQTQVKKEEPLPESLSFEGVPISDSKELLVYLNGRLKDRELVRELISNALKASVDSAKLVLDAVRWFFAPENKQGMDFEVNIIRKSCVLLLEVLMKLRPVIKPELSKEAMQLALDWKEKVKYETKNCVEVWGYLQLLGAFGLVGQFDSDEIMKLVGFVSERKQAPDLFRDLGFADKASGFIQKLISENKQVDAVRFIHAFEQVNKFPPAPLLRAHLKFATKDARMSYKKGKDLKAQHEAIDKEIVALRGIVRCIEEYKLDIEPQYSPETLRKCINELKKQKTKEGVATLNAGGSGTQVQHLSGKKRAVPDFKGQPNKQNRNKHPRIAPVSAARNASYGAPASAHLIRASYLRQETIQPYYLHNVTHARHLNLASRDYGLTSPSHVHMNSAMTSYGLWGSDRITSNMSPLAARYGPRIAANGEQWTSTRSPQPVDNTNPSPNNLIAYAYADYNDQPMSTSSWL